MMMGAVRTTGTSIHDESSGVCQISVAGAEKWTRPSSTMSEDGTLFDVDDPFAHQDTRPADPGAHDESLSLLRARLQDAVGMSSEGNLDGGCEDANLAGTPRLCREHERALGEVELPGNLLHLPVRETIGVGQDSELNATATTRGLAVPVCGRSPYTRPMCQGFHPDSSAEWLRRS